MNLSHSIAISTGDPAGIGPEIIAKALLADSSDSIAWVVYAGEEYRAYLKQHFPSLSSVSVPSVDSIASPGVYVVPVWEESYQLSPGARSGSSGKAALHSLEAATADLVEGKVDALVTAPIDKENIRHGGFDFPGHTEYLASKAEGQEPLMFLIGQDCRVGVLTGHIPLSQVASTVHAELLEKKVRAMQTSLIEDFGIARPRIAVFGLNPHAGDQGVIGNEEMDWINKAISDLSTPEAEVEGPFPADGFFGRARQREFDGILAMYHDQGLAPFKALNFGKGVNFTAGLPFIRTSPDHGTAFDIAGQGIADPSSMLEAMKLALKISLSRKKQPNC